MRIEEREKDMLDHFKDMNKMQEVLHEAQTGLWVIELEEGTKPRMYADKSMLDLPKLPHRRYVMNGGIIVLMRTITR